MEARLTASSSAPAGRVQVEDLPESNDRGESRGTVEVGGRSRGESEIYRNGRGAQMTDLLENGDVLTLPIDKVWD